MHRSDETTIRALALFDRYADMPHAQLNDALENLKQQDAAVHGTLVSLLDADATQYTFGSPLQWLADRASQTGASQTDVLQADVSQSDARADGGLAWRSGTRLGAWRIDSVIGIGGMGVVYAAHRADGLYEQDVALKAIRSELISPALLAAFGHERSNLARLEHPAIVSLLDAGIADDGQPWLAMQRVHGEPIDHWCDQQRASLRVRVERMVDACDAIRHAHTHGVLHQDVKPTNIMVTREGSVKLLDFGLSVLFSPLEAKKGPRIGISSAYAAPEVFRGAAPSTAIDIYALGVILYRLLCSESPVRPASLAAMPTGVEYVPRAPGALALESAPDIAALRGMRDARSLSRALDGDLNAIAMRCVREDPQERYASVADLQADLQAWLQGAPVLARGNGMAYRTRYALRRHMLAMVVTIGCALAVIAAASVFQQHRRAQLEAENTEVLGQLFEQSLGAATLSSLGNAPLNSRALLTDTERRLRAQAGAGGVSLLARGLTALARSHLIGGDYGKAARLAEEASSLSVGDALQTARTDAVLAQLSNMRALHADAERLVRDGLDGLPWRHGVGDDLVRLDLQMQLARAQWGQGDPNNAIAILDAAVAAAAALGEDGVPALAELLGQRGYARTQLFRFPDAEADLRRALSILGDRSPTIKNTLRRHLANLLMLSGRKQEAYRQASASLESNLRIFGPSHPETGRAWIIVGKSWFYLGDNARAKAAIDNAISILEAQIGADHPDLAEAIVIRGGLAFEKGDLRGALGHSRRALAILERAYGRDHEAALKRRTDLASILVFIADTAKVEEQDAAFREADSLLSDAIRIGQRQGLSMGYARDEYAKILLHFRRIAEAELQAQMAVSEVSSQFGPRSDYLVPAYMSFLKVRTAQGRYDEADAIGVKLLAQSKLAKESSYARFMLLDLLLDNEIARGDPERIRSAYREIERVAQRHGYMKALNAKIIPASSRG